MKLDVEACGSVRRLNAILNYEIKVQRNEEAESKEKIKNQLETKLELKLHFLRVENLFWLAHLIEVRANKLSILNNF